MLALFLAAFISVGSIQSSIVQVQTKSDDAQATLTPHCSAVVLDTRDLVAAFLNFAMILVTGKPVFAIPFKSLKEVAEARELLPAIRWETKKATS